MNASLYHKNADVHVLFGNAYYYDRLVNYTGRWRIIINTGVPTLLIECFHFVPKYKKKYITKSWLWGLFERTKYVGEVEDGFKASVYWVPEEKLELVIKEECPIQQCGGVYE